MISTYKKYWFVLEGRLLLYYRSKDEYDAISPCKGSINLGPPCAVKPCPSNNGLFQIETRYNTITLRCLDHDDQKRWMQAIMAALNQNQSIAKLSHFRYSLDSGINQNVDDQINGKSTPKRRNSLINRLQKLGGQSYGGSLGQISRIATSFGVTKTKSTETTFENQSKCQSAYFNNEHYSVIKSSSSGSVEFRKLVTNNQSEQEHLYEIVDKECTYSVPNKKSSPSQTRTTFIIDNEHYCGVDQTITFPNTDSEVIYTEPTCTGKIDHNDNTLIIDNPTYTTINRMVDNDEIVKSSSPSPTNSIIIENTDYMQINRNNNLYEDVDNFEISDNSSQTSDDKPKKRFQSFRRKFGFKDKMNTEQNKSIKKSQSFIKRVWKRKKDKKVQEDDIYETIQDDKVKKIELGDDETVQMLSELQNLLETKKPMLLVSEMKRQNKLLTVYFQQKMYEEPKSPEIPPKTTKKTHSPPPEKTIDEILDDLEQESGKTKVKTLIKKFSGDFHVNDDEEVTLRKSTRETNRENRFSDELTQLLDELTKVTSAPLMTPGVTMSLINPNLTDEEVNSLIFSAIILIKAFLVATNDSNT